MNGSPDRKVAIVTGGARGIGRAYCLGLADAGFSVVVADVLDGSAVVAEITDRGAEAMAVEVDVSDQVSTERMAASCAERFGRVDGLVNNAAYFKGVQRGTLQEIGVEEWDRAFAVNVRGTWLCIRAVHPFMRDAGGGRIVNVSSNTVVEGVIGFPHYVASKSAVVGLTRALARELGPHGITVNTVAPDYIPDESMLQAAPWRDEQVIDRRCLKRRMVAEDVVGTVVFLLGDGSAFITGQEILVNGGHHMH